QEISDNKNSRLEGDDPGLIGYWKLNEGGNNLITGISKQVEGSYSNPNWQETEELPFSDSEKFPSFKPIVMSDTNEQNINWKQFLELYAKLQMLKGNYDLGIKLLDIVRFETASPPVRSNPKYFELGNKWQLISLANAYLETDQKSISKKLIESIIRQNAPNENAFDINAIVYGALEKKLMIKLRN
ncbi:hypothetical protein OAK15_05500, partial [Verrucomicrobia bacterium]|nr:hypothetical protein [Verrucomicrobiota bacterium]